MHKQQTDFLGHIMRETLKTNTKNTFKSQQKGGNLLKTTG